MDNSVELLSTFQLFYHKNGRLPLTNGLIIVPDGDVSEGEEKINFKNLYEIIRHTKSHGLVSIQFLNVLSIFFGIDLTQIKNTITELYKILSYATLSGANDFGSNEIFDLTNALSFYITKSTLANRHREEEEDLKKEEEIIDSMTFVPLPDPFEQDLIDDQFENDLEYKKIEYPYVEPQVEDAQTIELETQAENDEFLKFFKEFDKVNNAAKEQKSQTDTIDLTDYILDEKNPFKNSVGTKDIWIEDDFFDNDDSQAIKDNLKEVIDFVKFNESDFFEDTDPENFETIDIPDNVETISIPDNLETVDFPDNFETINTFEDVEIPCNDTLAIDAPKKLKIISKPNSLRIASNKI